MTQLSMRRRAAKSRRWKNGVEVPDPNFPLSPHASGSWCKKIGGRIHHFGRWYRLVKGERVLTGEEGWRDALKEYHRRVGEDGRVVPCRNDTDADALTVKHLCNAFL